MRTFVFKSYSIILRVGNLVEEATDAIVCPANSFGHMRGGVAGAIRESGGNIIEEEVIAKAPVHVGSAVVTTAGVLKARFVIHAPTMKLPVQKTDANSIRKAMRAALRIAEAMNFESLSFPGMGTGTGWVKFEDAAEAMLAEIKSHLSYERRHLLRVSIIANSNAFFDCLVKSAEELFTNQK